MGGLLGETGGGVLCWGPVGYERKALGPQLVQPGVGSPTRNFESWLKGALDVERFSVWKPCEGKVEGGVPCWGL
jgi:hypothetical protein